MSNSTLYMFLLGCRPTGRNTEQHDVFFTISESLKDTIPAINAFWPQDGKIHIDAWREVTTVNHFQISIKKKTKNAVAKKDSIKLFFLNLGGYKPGEFEEFHYKMIVAAKDKTEAIKEAKATAFYKHTGFKGATSHIDDKFGIDVDDFYEIKDILPKSIKDKYEIVIKVNKKAKPDEWHLGYLQLSKIK